MAATDRVGLDDDELPKAKDAIHYIVDRTILDRMEGRAAQVSSLLQPVGLPTWAGELPFHLEPADWGAGYLEVHDRELPGQLYGDLKQCTPQALLRDLFRPEREAFVWYDREVLVTIDWGGTGALKEALAAQKREPLPRVEPLTHEVKRHADAWHRVLSERWKPILDDSEPRKRVLTFHELSLDV